MTKARAWPNQAEAIREECLARITRALGEMRSIARDDRISTVSLQRVVTVVDLLQECRVDLIEAKDRAA